MYIPQGSDVYYKHSDGERTMRATCDNGEVARQACELLNRASYLNDVKRQYTNAARLIAQAESLQGFRGWID